MVTPVHGSVPHLSLSPAAGLTTLFLFFLSLSLNILKEVEAREAHFQKAQTEPNSPVSSDEGVLSEELECKQGSVVKWFYCWDGWGGTECVISFILHLPDVQLQSPQQQPRKFVSGVLLVGMSWEFTFQTWTNESKSICANGRSARPRWRWSGLPRVDICKKSWTQPASNHLWFHALILTMCPEFNFLSGFPTWARLATWTPSCRGSWPWPHLFRRSTTISKCGSLNQNVKS